MHSTWVKRASLIISVLSKVFFSLFGNIIHNNASMWCYFHATIWKCEILCHICKNFGICHILATHDKAFNSLNCSSEMSVIKKKVFLVSRYSISKFLFFLTYILAIIRASPVKWPTRRTLHTRSHKESNAWVEPKV